MDKLKIVKQKIWCQPKDVFQGYSKNVLKLSPALKKKQEVNCKSRATKIYVLRTIIVAQLFLEQKASNQAYLCF